MLFRSATLEALGLIEDLKQAGSRAIDSTFSTVRRLTGDLFDIARAGIRQYTGSVKNMNMIMG